MVLGEMIRKVIMFSSSKNWGVSETNLSQDSENPLPNCTFMLTVAKYEFNISWIQLQNAKQVFFSFWIPSSQYQTISNLFVNMNSVKNYQAQGQLPRQTSNLRDDHEIGYVMGKVKVRWSSGDSQESIKSLQLSELDIGGLETCWKLPILELFVQRW